MSLRMAVHVRKFSNFLSVDRAEGCLRAAGLDGRASYVLFAFFPPPSAGCDCSSDRGTRLDDRSVQGRISSSLLFFCLILVKKSCLPAQLEGRFCRRCRGRGCRISFSARVRVQLFVIAAHQYITLHRTGTCRAAGPSATYYLSVTHIRTSAACLPVSLTWPGSFETQLLMTSFDGSYDKRGVRQKRCTYVADLRRRLVFPFGQVVRAMQSLVFTVA